MKAFTRRSVLDGLESRKLPIVVMNMATVDDPGMIVCIVRIVSCRHWLQEGFPASSIYHIGVGSRVARSTTMGNARASVRGTGNSRSPTLFLCLKAEFCLELGQHRYGCRCSCIRRCQRPRRW